MARHWAEGVARNYLEARGYVFLAENYASRQGELDLVMQDGEVIVFVEVRQRRGARYGGPAESLTRAKLGRLRQTALQFLLERYKQDDLSARFDAVLLEGDEQSYRLEHLRDIL